MTSGKTPKSNLVNIGLLLVLLGLMVSILERRFLQGSMTLPLALAIDCLKAGFFVGLALLAIGLLRNKRGKNSSTEVR